MENIYFTLNDREWSYKGEGNAHLALSLPKDQLVLRFEKVLQDIPIHDNSHSSQTQLEVDFINIVMTKLLGKHFVTPPQIVHFQKQEVENLNEALFPVRPESRRHKKIGNCSATLWPDLCFLLNNLSNRTAPTFSVEIKPKQGIFAPPDQGTKQCLFCSKQELKLKKKSAHERSEYCPLMLFSGDPVLMTAALKGLLHTPQNNLSIYKDGKPIFGSESSAECLREILSDWLQNKDGTSLEDRVCVILLDVLTRTMDSVNETSKDELAWQDDGPPLLCRLADSAKRPSYADSRETNSRRQCYWGKQNLPSGCVLQKLSAVQSLGVCGQAAAYELYKQEVNEGADDYTYVKNIFDAGCSSALSPLQCYLLSALGRDCSIMIAFQRSQDISSKDSLPEVTDPGTGSSYVFQIRFMDLDPKPLSCVEKHRRRNCEIALAKKNSVN